MTTLKKTGFEKAKNFNHYSIKEIFPSTMNMIMWVILYHVQIRFQLAESQIVKDGGRGAISYMKESVLSCKLSKRF